MNLRTVFSVGVMAFTLLGFASPALAQDGPYIQMDLGIAVARAVAPP